MSISVKLYRDKMDGMRFRPFVVTHLDTDVWVGIDKASYSDNIREFVQIKIIELRRQLDEYIVRNRSFLDSFAPLNDDIHAPEIARDMMQASGKAGIGPMGAVAGAFAQYIGREVIKEFKIDEIIIENGGDIFMKIKNDINLSVFAGKSPFSESFLLKVKAGKKPMGICTSSGKYGHSASLGKADAVMIACRDTLLADAYATAFCNKIQTEEDIEKIIDEIKNNKDILSSVIICDNRIGICGEFRMAEDC